MTKFENKYIVQGTSMIPTLLPGDIIKILHVSDTKVLKKGDSVVYTTANKSVIHRIIGIENSYVVTQGDNAWHTDKIPLKDIIGIATYNITQRKHLQRHKLLRRRWHKIVNKLWRILYGESRQDRIVALLKKKSFWYYFYRTCM